MKILILYSGGLDSLILEKWAKVHHPDAEITLLYFDIGQGYNYKELAVLPDNVIVKKIPWLDGDTGKGKEGNASGNIFIPGRNLVFAVNAACMFLPDEIWMGALCGEDHPAATDKNAQFLEKVNNTLHYVLSPFKKVTLKHPFIEAKMGKLDITKWALEKGGFTAEQLINSSSCLSADEGKCGTCVVCVRRWGIFSQLGLSEEYNARPVEDNKKFLLSVINEDHYDQYRKAEIVPALMSYFNTNDIETIKEILSK